MIVLEVTNLRFKYKMSFIARPYRSIVPASNFFMKRDIDFQYCVRSKSLSVSEIHIGICNYDLNIVMIYPT